jgi:hypothetical protein
MKNGPVAKHSHPVRSVGGAAAGVAVCLTAFAVFTASAQTAPPVDAPPESGHLEALARMLSDGVSCTSGNPHDVLDERGRKSGAAPADIGAALAIISSSGEICPPVRTAASALGSDMIAQQMAAMQASQAAEPADSTSGAAAAARASLASAALDAEVQAAATKFEVGPPPKNLTRGRIAGS